MDRGTLKLVSKILSILGIIVGIAAFVIPLIFFHSLLTMGTGLLGESSGIQTAGGVISIPIENKGLMTINISADVIFSSDKSVSISKSFPPHKKETIELNLSKILSDNPDLMSKLDDIKFKLKISGMDLIAMELMLPLPKGVS